MYYEIIRPARPVRSTGSTIINSVQAAELAEVHRNTIHRWCHRHGIGWKVGGRYRIIKEKLLDFLKGPQE
jgi:excisionase family DNA binding protein